MEEIRRSIYGERGQSFQFSEYATLQNVHMFTILEAPQLHSLEFS